MVVVMFTNKKVEVIKMKIAKYLIAILALVSSTATWSMDWLPVNQLDNIRIDKSGSIYGNTIIGVTQSGCTTTNFTIPHTQPGFNAMLSVLLSALAAQKDVQLSLGECSTSGTLVIDGVRINK